MATLTVMGRPRLSDEDRRDKPLRIRLADAEREKIDAAAEAAGMTASKWARQLLLDAAEKQSAGNRKR
ncbi:hypothetical protein GC176_23085 [bacterium]|nr:hypothetical protein [bacterium]